MKRLAMRECVAPTYLHNKPQNIEGIGVCRQDQYGHSFMQVGNKWWQAWEFAFHTVCGRCGSTSSQWCWMPKYN